MAFATCDIRFDGTVIARLNTSIVLGYFKYFDAQFMPQHSWIGEEGLPPCEGVEDGAADTDPFDTHECVVGCGDRFGDVSGDKVTGVLEDDLEHDGSVFPWSDGWICWMVLCFLIWSVLSCSLAYASGWYGADAPYL